MWHISKGRITEQLVGQPCLARSWSRDSELGEAALSKEPQSAEDTERKIALDRNKVVFYARHIHN